MKRNSFNKAFSILREASLGLVSVRMSKVAFHLDFVAYPPVIIICLYMVQGKISVAFIVFLFIFGLVIWTLAEYLLHRFVLHGWPFFARYHHAHHDNPSALIASPTLFSLGVFVSTALIPATLLLGFWPALPCFAGFLMGYIAFAAVRETVHHAQSQNAVVRHFKLFHARHHHATQASNFGVLTSFWDRVFGTYVIVRRSGLKGLRPARYKPQRQRECLWSGLILDCRVPETSQGKEPSPNTSTASRALKDFASNRQCQIAKVQHPHNEPHGCAMCPAVAL